MAPPPPPPPPPMTGPPRRVVFQMPALENVEDVNMYAFGGNHPVKLGEVVGHKFKILHKLGNGGFALVWLARNLENNTNVALKILKADAPDDEISILERLRSPTRNPRFTNLHETFKIDGPNGRHQCLVLDLGGPSLRHMTLKCRRPPFSFLKESSRALVEGLAAIHSVGVCHGDLTHRNILFEISGIQNWTEEELFLHLGRPKTAPLLLSDGKPPPPFAPTDVVNAIDYSHFSMELLSGQILITDFGEAFLQDNVPEGLGTPPSFAAPELAFDYPPSSAVDLWALGCLIFELHTFHVLIPTIFGCFEETVLMAIETIGALPEAWQHSYYDKEQHFLPESPDQKHRWFDDDIEWTRTLDSQLLRDLPDISQDERAALLHLLERLLVFEPGNRSPAAEVVKEPWFQSG